MNGGELIGAYIFGSVARGKQDHLSDLDILVVVRNGMGKVSDGEVLSRVPEKLRSLRPSISWYGANRIEQMFRNGELFAWHLFQENLPIFDPNNFLKNVGKPAGYRDALLDVASFRKVLQAIPQEVRANEGNAIYEAGLVYVCLRNIAMSSSWSLCSRPDFSRYSVFNLEGIAECPMSISEFEKTMLCRMAGQRGTEPPEGVDKDFVLRLHARLTPWLEALQATLEELEKRG
ncbi:nucleotidyltransferase domain-containing protein (plasmid) [Rhizobium lusitanum]|uniref:nucleotidyltransferase domain-containing protein n=1 Tax=Rhizobium lusitanum TaxID=293958 RepID=UPI00161F30FD|nr:nucleotidyltransferase domain-containing protein [Rhizobium lusitanum]QND44642.1 nucleotidyltransferase domain-containing protein [Rhizobium lusitanum]